MKLRETVRPDLIFLDIEPSDAETSMSRVSNEIASVEKLDAEVVAKALTEREKLGSTSVGGGFAIPHCKLAGIDEIIVALARFDGSIDFGNSNHREPVSFFFVVLSPPDRPAQHLQILSQIARILKNSDLRSGLLEAPTASAIVEAIDRAAVEEGL